MSHAIVPTASVTGSSTTPDRRDTKPVIRTTVPSGWYDPDGAAWEAESPPAIEALRASPMRPAILLEAVDPENDN